MKGLIPIAIALLLLAACGSEPDAPPATVISETIETEVFEHPEWSKDAVIYEVNVRQHTPQGTLKAFAKDLPRLAEMGVEIIWLMPVHPIGVEQRKGGMGSYYSVMDYRAVNPEFGDEEDLRDVCERAHVLGMRVILDWVANHSAWDNPWTENPAWYTLDSAGGFMPPVADWSDVIDLNYGNAEMRQAMIDAMKYWINECEVDGFRCDVASMVPTDFWNEATRQLREVNPELFMLAEAEVPEHHLQAFDMSYSWELMHIMNHIAMEEGLTDPALMAEKGWHSDGMDLSSLDDYLAKEDTNFVDYAYRMTFTSNHDENSWNGTVFERYGPAHQLFATLAFTVQGMPLLYSGMEAPLRKRLAFFEKDSIDWNGYELQDFYSRLIRVNKEEEALWNGSFGGDFKRIATADDDEIYAYSRTKGKSQVITVLNFSPEPRTITFKEAIAGEYPSIFNNQTLSVFTDGDMTLEPWGYQVFVKQ